MIVECIASIYPTEDLDKVRAAMLNIFPDGVEQLREGSVHLVADSMDAFVHMVKEQKILDTASMIIRRSLEGDSTSFFLNKQAAIMGVVNFTEGTSGLGDIEVGVLEGAAELISELSSEIGRFRSTPFK